MVTLAQLESWRPEQLGTIGDQLNQDRKKLIDLQDEMYEASPPASWIGDAAVAAEDRHTDLVADLNDVVANISPVIEALDTASAALTSARDRALEVRDTVRSNGWELSVSGTTVRITDPSPAEDEGDRDDDQSRMDTLARDLAQALADADEADGELTTALQASRRGAVDGGTGTIADAALPIHLRELSTSELIDAFLDDPSAYNSYVDALSTEQQQELGRQVATRAEPLADHDYWIAVRQGDKWFPEEGDLSHLAELLTAYGSDSTVATSILNQLGAENVLDIQQTLASVPAVEDDPIVDPAVLGAQQRGWGDVLAAATSGLTADGQGGTADRVSSDYVQDLLGRGDDNYQLGDLNNANGYQLLGPLLHDTDHGSYFLNEVGDHLEAYEKEQVDEYGSAPWDFSNENQIDYTSGSFHTFDGDGDDTIAPGRDPFHALMDGLSHNPEAAQQFFSSNPNEVGGEGDPFGRVQHYLRDREWPQVPWSDQPGISHEFGNALVAATTQDPTPTSVDIAERAVTVGADGELPSDAIRRSYGEIVSAYMPDVYEALSGGDPRTSGDALPWLEGEQDPALRADFSDPEVRSLLGDIGRDEAANQAVTGAAVTYANYGYDHYFSGAEDGPVDDRESLDDVWEQRREAAQTHVNNPYAAVLGSLGEGASDQLFEDGQAADAEASSRGDGKYQAGGYIVGQLGGQVPFVGGVISDGVGVITDGLVGMNDVDTSAEVRADIAEQVAGTRGAAEAVAEDAVYRNLPDSVLNEYQGDDGTPVFTDANGHRIPMSEWGEEQINAWQDVRDSTGAGGTSAQLAEDLKDQLSGSGDDAEDNEGE